MFLILTLLFEQITTLLDQTSYNFAVKKYGDILNSNISVATTSPEILTRPIYFTIENLHPFDVPVYVWAFKAGMLC